MASLVSVVDDDDAMRESLPELLEELGFAAQAFASAEEFLASATALEATQCLVLDIAMPGMTGPELQRLLVTTRASKRTFRGLDGEARFHLYACACGTGFRASALAGLTPDCFRLKGGKAEVRLRVRNDKSRKGKSCLNKRRARQAIAERTSPMVSGMGCRRKCMRWCRGRGADTRLPAVDRVAAGPRARTVNEPLSWP